MCIKVLKTFMYTGTNVKMYLTAYKMIISLLQSYDYTCIKKIQARIILLKEKLYAFLLPYLNGNSHFTEFCVLVQLALFGRGEKCKSKTTNNRHAQAKLQNSMSENKGISKVACIKSYQNQFTNKNDLRHMQKFKQKHTIPTNNKP